MLDFNIRIDMAKMNVAAVTKCFYQGKQQEGYKHLITVIDELIAISDFIDSSDQEQLRICGESLKEVLQNAMKALADKDEVMFADIFNYEIIPILDDLLKE